MPALRLQFPFLLKTAFLGRAKRSVRFQPLPMLLNSFRAHKKAVTGISYISKSKLLLTSSSDCSVRLWTLAGRYIGTFGSPVHWPQIYANQLVNDGYKFRIPPDIKREASFTTLHVLTDAKTHPVFQKKPPAEDDEQETMAHKEMYRCVYGKSLKEPILGSHFALPPRLPESKKPVFDMSIPHVRS